MPLFTVGKLRDHTYVWILSSPLHDKVYEEHPQVLSYTRVTAKDGPTALAVAMQRLNGYKLGKLACNKKDGHKSKAILAELKEEQIIEVLYNNLWSAKNTAKELGIHVDTLYKLMRQYNIPTKNEKRSVA